MFTIKQTYRLGKCLLFGILISLVGCINYTTSSLTTSPKHFDLIAPEVNKVEKSENNQVVIMKPMVNQALSRKKIAVVTNTNQISYFHDWYWSDDLSSLIQAKIVEVFENNGYFEGVGIPNQGISTDYRIVTEIRSFQFEERVAGVKTRNCESHDVITLVNEKNDESKIEYWSVADITVKIIYERKGRVEAIESYCVEGNVESKNAEIAVDGLNFVLGEVLKKIVFFTVKEVKIHLDELKRESKI